MSERAELAKQYYSQFTPEEQAAAEAQAAEFYSQRAEKDTDADGIPNDEEFNADLITPKDEAESMREAQAEVRLDRTLLNARTPGLENALEAERVLFDLSEIGRPKTARWLTGFSYIGTGWEIVNGVIDRLPTTAGGNTVPTPSLAIYNGLPAVYGFSNEQYRQLATANGVRGLTYVGTDVLSLLSPTQSDSILQNFDQRDFQHQTLPFYFTGLLEYVSRTWSRISLLEGIAGGPQPTGFARYSLLAYAAWENIFPAVIGARALNQLDKPCSPGQANQYASPEACEEVMDSRIYGGNWLAGSDTSDGLILEAPEYLDYGLWSVVHGMSTTERLAAKMAYIRLTEDASGRITPWSFTVAGTSLLQFGAYYLETKKAPTLEDVGIEAAGVAGSLLVSHLARTPQANRAMAHIVPLVGTSIHLPEETQLLYKQSPETTATLHKWSPRVSRGFVWYSHVVGGATAANLAERGEGWERALGYGGMALALGVQAAVGGEANKETTLQNAEAAAVGALTMHGLRRIPFVRKWMDRGVHVNPFVGGMWSKDDGSMVDRDIREREEKLKQQRQEDRAERKKKKETEAAASPE